MPIACDHETSRRSDHTTDRCNCPRLDSFDFESGTNPSEWIFVRSRIRVIISVVYEPRSNRGIEFWTNRRILIRENGVSELKRFQDSTIPCEYIRFADNFPGNFTVRGKWQEDAKDGFEYLRVREQQRSRFHDTNSLRNSFYYYVVPASNFVNGNIHRRAFWERSIPRDDQTSRLAALLIAMLRPPTKQRYSRFRETKTVQTRNLILPRLSRMSGYFDRHQILDAASVGHEQPRRKKLHLIIRRLSRTRCPR